MVDGFINKDVVLVVDAKKSLTKASNDVKQDLRRYLDADAINSVLNKPGDSRERMFLLLLWRTGIRVTEAIGITLADIDFVNKTITIKWQKNRKYLRRVVPIQASLRDLLSVFCAGLNLVDRLFPFTRQRAWQIVVKWFGRGVHPHTFRHSFAVNWLRQGGDLVVLHRVLGHNRLQATMEYLKIVPVDQARELDKISFS